MNDDVLGAWMACIAIFILAFTFLDDGASPRDEGFGAEALLGIAPIATAAAWDDDWEATGTRPRLPAREGAPLDGADLANGEGEDDTKGEDMGATTGATMEASVAEVAAAACVMPARRERPRLP